MRRISARTSAGLLTEHSTSEEITLVDAMVRQVGALGDAIVEVEAHARPLSGGPQPAVHVGIGLDGDERGPWAQVTEVGADSGPELDDLSGQVGEDAPLVLPEVPLEVRADQAEERGVEAATRGMGLEPDHG